MRSRRRNLFVILLVLGFLVVSGIVIVAKPTRLGLDLKGGVQLVYKGEPTPQSAVTSDAIGRSIDQIRSGCDALGVSETEVQRLGTDEIVVGIPDVKNAGRAISQCGKPAQMYFYDFEKNVVGGTSPINGLFKAVTLASKQPAVVDSNNTVGQQFYLFNKRDQALSGPDTSRKDVLSQFNGVKPKGAKVITVPPGTIVVQAEKPDTVPKNAPFNQFYVLKDNPELSGKELKDPKQQTDPNTGEPNVTFSFTGKGREAFHNVTRRLAQRGQTHQIPGQPPQSPFQT